MDNQAPFLSFYGVLISYPLMAFPPPRYCPPKFKVLDTAAHRLWGCFSLIQQVWFQDSIHFWAAAGCSSALSRVFKVPSPASFDFLMDAFFLHTGKLPFSGPLAIISCSRPGSTAQACPKLPGIPAIYAQCRASSWQSARPSLLLSCVSPVFSAMPGASQTLCKYLLGVWLYKY